MIPGIGGLELGGVWPSKEELFMEVMTDLEALHKHRRPYGRLRAAALLRLLLLDGAPLMEQANRRARVRLRFMVGNHLGRPGREQTGVRPAAEAVLDGFDGRIPARDEVKPEEMTRERMLACPVVRVGEHTYTSKDIIEHVAYVDGLVHAGESLDDAQAALESVRRRFAILGLDVALRHIVVLERMTLSNLAPLGAAIRPPNPPRTGTATSTDN